MAYFLTRTKFIILLSLLTVSSVHGQENTAIVVGGELSGLTTAYELEQKVVR